MELSEFKSQVIQMVKNNYTVNVIEPIWPNERNQQITVLMNGGQDLIDMTDFINTKRAEIQVIEDAINALTDQTILDNFTGSTDIEQAAYVASALPILTEYDQQIYVACALRLIKINLTLPIPDPE